MTQPATQPITQGPAAATGTQSTETQAQGQPQGAPEAQPATETQPPANETLEAAKARLEAEVTRLRRENGTERVTAKATAAAEAATAKEKELVASILGALGMTPEGKKEVSVQDLTSQLSNTQAELKAMRLKETVRTVSADVKADPERLLRHVDFLKAVEGLDPADTAGVKKAATEALKEYPYLMAGLVSGKSGTDMSGGSGEGTKSLAEQIAELETAGNFAAAQRLKTRSLLGM
ncbi:hypothetical protein [Tessaracoccus sp.]